MTFLAKKKGSNIQRKNMQPKVPVIHPSLGNAKLEKVAEQTEHVNSYTFTTVGMFAGLIIGYLLNEINWGFGIGLFAGAIIDFVLNSRKKKAFDEKHASALESANQQ